MTGRRGPVFLELRETALVKKANNEDLNKIVDPVKYRSLYYPSENPELIDKSINFLKVAKKPLIIAGGGTISSEASEELIKLSETYMIPSLTTIMGIGSISTRQNHMLVHIPCQIHIGGQIQKRILFYHWDVNGIIRLYTEHPHFGTKTKKLFK